MCVCVRVCVCVSVCVLCVQRAYMNGLRAEASAEDLQAAGLCVEAECGEVGGKNTLQQDAYMAEPSLQSFWTTL